MLLEKVNVLDYIINHKILLYVLLSMLLFVIRMHRNNIERLDNIFHVIAKDD